MKKKIKIKAEDLGFNPTNIAEMSQKEWFEEHLRRQAKDPGYEEGWPPKIWIYHDEISYMDEVEALWGKKWGAQGLGRLREVLLCRPTENELYEWYDDRTTFLQWSANKPNLSRWLEQHESLCRVYRENGVLVHEATPPTPVISPYGFSRWLWAIAGAGTMINGGAVTPRAGMTATARARHPLYQRILAELGVPILHTCAARRSPRLAAVCGWTTSTS